MNAAHSIQISLIMADHTTSIQSPYSISHLPLPLDPINGKTFVSDIFGLVGSRKRKRNEIAIATDGESINVYDVRVYPYARS